MGDERGRRKGRGMMVQCGSNVYGINRIEREETNPKSLQHILHARGQFYVLKLVI